MIVTDQIITRPLFKRHTFTTPHQLFCQYDPQLGWSKIPNKIGQHYNSEYQTVEHINSRGLRGREYAYEKPKGVRRILLLGDSFVEGYSVDEQAVISEQLHKLLAGSGQYEIINGGTGGYSTDQELLFLQHEGLKYKPDLVILFFFFNDVHYNSTSTYQISERGNKPFFELNEGKLQLKGVPVPTPEKTFWNPSAWLQKNSFLYERISWILYDLLPKPLPPELAAFLETPSPQIASSWEITEALVKEIKNTSQSAGAKFLLFHVPSIQEANDSVWKRFTKRYRHSNQKFNSNEIHQRLEKISKKHSIDYLSTLQAFRAEEIKLNSNKNSLFFRFDAHWNASGHAFAAKLLTEKIRGK